MDTSKQACNISIQPQTVKPLLSTSEKYLLSDESLMSVDFSLSCWRAFADIPKKWHFPKIFIQANKYFEHSFK